MCLKKSGVHNSWFFDTSGNLEEDITKLSNKVKMKNTCLMLFLQMTNLHKNVQSIFLHEKFRKTGNKLSWYKVWFRAVGARRRVAGCDFPQYFKWSVNHIPTRGTDYAHHVTTCPPEFQTFIRLCDLFVIHSAVRYEASATKDGVSNCTWIDKCALYMVQNVWRNMIF